MRYTEGMKTHETDTGVQVYRVREVAKLLRVSPSTVYGMIARGELRCAWVGRVARIPREEVERVLAGE